MLVMVGESAHGTVHWQGFAATCRIGKPKPETFGFLDLTGPCVLVFREGVRGRAVNASMFDIRLVFKNMIESTT